MQLTRANVTGHRKITETVQEDMTDDELQTIGCGL